MNENIYSTVPREIIYDEMRKNLIFMFLRNRAGKFYTAKQLAELAELPTKDTCVAVRKIITELIEIDKEPIVSNNIGFAYANTKRMLEICLENLENRSLGLQRRIQSLREIYQNDRQRSS